MKGAREIGPGGVVVMSLDNALALAGQVLADYDAPGPNDRPGPDILWSDQLARALRELTAATSAWHVAPVSDWPVAVIPAARQSRPGGQRPGRVRGPLARILWAWAGRVPGQVREPGAVVLSAADVDVIWQALADAGAWHGVYGDCAVCVGGGVCGEMARHEVIAVQYAALRAWLGDRR